MKIKNPKKQAVALILFIFSYASLTGITQAEERSNFIQRFSIKISSGLSYLTVGDINTFLESENQRHIDRAQYFNGLKKGELKKVRFGFDSEIELTFDITSRLRIGLGSGFIYGGRESSSGFEVEESESFYVDFTYAPEIDVSAIPLKLGVYYTFPFKSEMKLYINGGIGYYFARTYFYRKQKEVFIKDGSIIGDYRGIVDWDLSSKGIGFHGGVGFEYSFTKNFSLFTEVQGRYAQIKKLERDNIYESSEYYGPHYCGTMYYFEEKRDIFIDKYYSSLGISREKPDEPEYRNVREARLDLSGFCFKVGIKIRLF